MARMYGILSIAGWVALVIVLVFLIISRISERRREDRRDLP